MTQFSYPWEGIAAPGSITDGGYYSAFQWNGVWVAMMRAGGTVLQGASPLPAAQTMPNVGVFYSVDSQLAVSTSGNNLISIAAGAALVDGQFFYNSAAITDTAVASCATPAMQRTDRVVIRKNFGNSTYTPTNVPALTVPPKSTRITVISGADGGGAPGYTQDTTRVTYWDIPLYQYNISDAGVLSAKVDLRNNNYVDAETKHVFLQAQAGYDVTGGAALIRQTAYGLALPDAASSLVYFDMTTPKDYISGMTATAVIMTTVGVTGNIYHELAALWCADGEPYDQHTSYPGVAAEAIAADLTVYELASLSITPTADDFITFRHNRDATNPLDTLGSYAYIKGIHVSYFGWGRK